MTLLTEKLTFRIEKSKEAKNQNYHKYKVRQSYPLAVLKVGECFVGPLTLYKSINGAARQHGRIYGKKFKLETTSHGNVKCHRIA